MQRIAEIEEFFEEEKLDTGSDNKVAPVLKPSELRDLPCSKYELNMSSARDTDAESAKKLPAQHKCIVCQNDFEVG